MARPCFPFTPVCRQQNDLAGLAPTPLGHPSCGRAPVTSDEWLDQGPTFLTSRRPYVSKGSSSAQSPGLLVSAGAHPESTGHEQCLRVTGFPSVRENSSIEWQFPAFVPGP